MRERTPGRPRKNTAKMSFNLLSSAQEVLAKEAARLDFEKERADGTTLVMWGDFFAAVAGALVAGKINLDFLVDE